MSISSTSPLPKSSGRRNYLTKGLFTTVLASWMVAPLGVLTLHFSGMGSDPVLIAILVALSVGAPFQILTNEFLAVGNAGGAHKASNGLIAALMVMHAIAGTAALTTTNYTQWQLALVPNGLVIVSLVTVNLLLSYLSVQYYIELLIKGNIDVKQSIINGSITGLVTFIIFIFAAISGSRTWLYMSIFVPGILHFFYFRILFLKKRNEIFKSTDLLVSPSGFFVLFFGLLLSIITYFSSYIRITIIDIFPEYSALTLVAINMVGTVFFTIFKIDFISDKNGIGNIFINIYAIFLIFITVLLFIIENKYFAFPAMMLLQIMSVYAIILLRRFGYSKRS